MTTLALGATHGAGRRRRYVPAAAIVMVGGVVVALRLGSPPPPPPPGPRADLYVMIEQGPASPLEALAHDEVYRGDRLHVSVTGDPDTYLTLFYFDALGRLQVAQQLRSQGLPELSTGWTAIFEVDEAAGQEQVVALVTRRPVGALHPLTVAANRSTSDRTARLAAFDRAARAALPEGSFSVRPSAVFRHR